jgi:hypothetical protein
LEGARIASDGAIGPAAGDPGSQDVLQWPGRLARLGDGRDGR